MARPVYSKQLAAEHLIAPASITVILPDANTYVIRDITWMMLCGPDAGATLQVQFAGLNPFIRSVPSDTAYGLSEELRGVAPGPTSLLLELTGDGATCDVVISGYELTP